MIAFDPDLFRQQFPALHQHGVYLDSAATTLTPEPIIRACQDYYYTTASVHRSSHPLAQKMTEKFEHCRQQVANWLGVIDPRQIIWTRGATESINLVARCWLAQTLKPGDEIIVSELEHHANLLPWLMLAREYGVTIIRWSLDHNNLPDVQQLPQLITDHTRLIAVTQMSNVTGGQPDLTSIIQIAHQFDVKVMVDGAQGVAHQRLNLAQLGADFYAFSAHKLYGPTGLGILWVNPDLLEQLTPWQGGGKMISEVTFDGYQLLPMPWCLEAGTPNMAAIYGFSATLDWLNTLDLPAAEAYSARLAEHAEALLSKLVGFQSFRNPGSSLLSFQIAGIHTADLAEVLNQKQIAVRSGKHCAQPLMEALHVNGLLRASFAPYNNRQDVQKLVESVNLAVELLAE